VVVVVGAAVVVVVVVVVVVGSPPPQDVCVIVAPLKSPPHPVSGGVELLLKLEANHLRFSTKAP
jgi:hypothetical protein